MLECVYFCLSCASPQNSDAASSQPLPPPAYVGGLSTPLPHTHMQVIAFDAFCVAIQRDVQNILAMHDNSQCACGSICTGPGATTGGNVPVVRDLTYQPEATTQQPTPNSSLHTATDVGPGLDKQRENQPPPPQQQRWSSSRSSLGSRADASVSRSSLHIDVCAASTAQQPPIATDLQSPAGPAGGMSTSESRTCLLSAHTHRE